MSTPIHALAPQVSIFDVLGDFAIEYLVMFGLGSLNEFSYGPDRESLWVAPWLLMCVQPSGARLWNVVYECASNGIQI